MAGPHGTSKTKLSKNTMQMKFMQRCTVQSERAQNEAEKQRVIDDEHWVLDLPELQKTENKFIIEPSYVPIEGLKFGRMSFGGVNPEIEKLMKIYDQNNALQAAEDTEKEKAVSDEQMTERYTSLVGTINKKFQKKRHRSSKTDEEHIDKKKRTFMKPEEN